MDKGPVFRYNACAFEPASDGAVEARCVLATVGESPCAVLRRKHLNAQKIQDYDNDA